MMNYFKADFSLLRESGERLQNIVEKLEQNDLLVPPELCQDDEDIKQSDIHGQSNGVDTSCDNDIVGEPMDLSNADSECEGVLKSHIEDGDTEISPEELRARCYEDEDILNGPELSSEDAATDSNCSSTSCVCSDQDVDSRIKSDCGKLGDSVEPSSGEDQTKPVENEDLKNDSENNLPEKESSSAGSEVVVHIHLDNVGSSFDSFQYWRTPFPEIDLDFDSTVDAATNFHHITAKVSEDWMYDAPAPEESDTSSASTSNTFNSNRQALSDDFSDSLNWLNCSDDIMPRKSVIEEGMVTFHTASVNTVCDNRETVDNIGSTHVLGEHLNETTMKLVDGVVKGLF